MAGDELINILDRFTSIDDLLVTLLERIGGVTEEDTHFFSYPNDGTRATITKGTTTLDFMSGTAMTPAGAVSNLGNSLRARGREYCRSLSLQADRDIIIQIGTKSKIPVFAGTWFKVAHLRFTDVKIVAAESTRVFVIACTNPDSIEMAGESYVKDPVDVWGKLATIGNAEAAVRAHSPALMFDRRGDVIRWVDFESSTPNYSVYDAPPGGEPAHGRTTARSATGDFSYYVTVSNTQYINMQMYTNDFHLGRLGGQALFMSADTDFTIDVAMNVFTGSDIIYAILRYNRNTEKLQYYDDDGNYIDIGSLAHRAIDQNWSTLKIVADFDRREYTRAIVFGSEYDISGIPLRVNANGTDAHLFFKTKITGVNATPSTVYLDNIILTEGEPI